MIATSKSPSTEQLKRELRKTMLARRAAVGASTVDRVSRLVCRYLADWLRAHDIKTVFFYMPVRHEIDGRYLVDRLPHLRYALPVTEGDTMNFFPWSPTTPMREGRFAIPEPVPMGAPLVPDESTVVLVPSLAMAHDGVRLGYGGGYFDRYLTRYPAHAIALLADQFLIPSLPRDRHDVRIKWVATESGVTQLCRLS